MSHSTIEFSPAGTPLLDRTVGELVAERPGRSRIFQRHSIDFCCQGGRTLRDACERKGLPVASIAQELEQELAIANDSELIPALLPLHQLCGYITERHHGFLRQELPRLHAMSERVARVHGGHTPCLIEVFHVFCELADELVTHLLNEEQEVFPAISALDQNPQADGLAEAIDRLGQEHQDAADALGRLRQLTNGFMPPPEACNTYRALFAGLHDLERDLQQHIHLENSTLFPRALASLAGR
jgi:regulator of cell morphogenesis and NO signaling